MANQSKYTGWGLALGAALGTALGVMAGNVAVWLAIGVAVGIALGAASWRKSGCPECEQMHRAHDVRGKEIRS